jgi:hypothetical protein
LPSQCSPSIPSRVLMESIKGCQVFFTSAVQDNKKFYFYY